MDKENWGETTTLTVYLWVQGKIKLFGFFVGQTMKASGGRADPKALNELLKSMLET